MLERNGHGGDWVTATETFTCGLDQLLDYSANINPLGPPPALKYLLSNEWDLLMRYPDPEVLELRARISGKYGVMPESVIVGNGAAEVIDLIARALRPKMVAVMDPTFSEYREAAEKSGAKVISIPTSEEEGFTVPLQTIIDTLSKVDAIFLGQPNNPTGRRWEREALAELVFHAERLGTKLIIDEAFVDFFPDESEITMIREAERSSVVIVVRSMTKFYAIPGLRLGYAVAESSLIREMKRLQVPWSVNHLAQKAGVMVLEDLDYERRSRQLVMVERSWLFHKLAQLGCHPFEGTANFLLVHLGNHQTNAKVLQYKLGAQGILIRRCKTFIGLDDRYIRIAVRTHAENERFITVLEATLSQPTLEVK